MIKNIIKIFKSLLRIILGVSLGLFVIYQLNLSLNSKDGIYVNPAIYSCGNEFIDKNALYILNYTFNTKDYTVFKSTTDTNIVIDKLTDDRVWFIFDKTDPLSENMNKHIFSNDCVTLYRIKDHENYIVIEMPLSNFYVNNALVINTKKGQMPIWQFTGII